MNQAWGIGKRWFFEDFERKLFIFNHLVKSVIMYGAEIWGWEEHEKVEAILTRYIRWILELDRCTPSYIVRMEAKVDKIRIDAGRRAVKFEMKVRRERRNEILLECYRVLDRGEETKWTIKRKNYLERCETTAAVLVEKATKGDKEWDGVLAETDRQKQKLEDAELLGKARYHANYRNLVTEKRPRYLVTKGRRGSHQMIARFRCGNEERGNRYWEAEEKRMCRMCGQAVETMVHIIGECDEDLVAEDVVEMLNETGEGVTWMREVVEKRKLLLGI